MLHSYNSGVLIIMCMFWNYNIYIFLFRINESSKIQYANTIAPCHHLTPVCGIFISIQLTQAQSEQFLHHAQ